MAVGDLVTLERRSERRRGHLARAMARLFRKKIAMACVTTLAVIYLAGILAAWVSPYDYTRQDYTAIRKPPGITFDQGVIHFWSNSHLAGTDFAGRDQLTRVLWGIQNTVILTIVGMLSGGLVIGVSLGLISGYFGKKIDSLIMRVGEVFASFPTIFLVIIIAATLRPRIIEWVRWIENDSLSFVARSNLVDYALAISGLAIAALVVTRRLGGRWAVSSIVALAIALALRPWWLDRLGSLEGNEIDGLVKSGLPDYIVVSAALVSFGWIGIARLVRGQILYLKQTQHVEAARAIGASTPRILFLHLLPNAIGPIVVTVSMGMGTMIGTEIILSWFGLGIQPPKPSLGIMLFEAGSISALKAVPWMLLAPSAAAFILLLAWNLLGDALNDVLNPRTR